LTVRVKVCGLSRIQDLNAAIQWGADAVGFVVGFPESPRNLDLNRAQELIKRTPPFLTSVVVCPYKTHLIRQIVTELQPNALQVYGNADGGKLMTTCAGSKVIRPVAIGGEGDLHKARDLSRECDAIILDTRVKGVPGGSGIPINLELARKAGKLVAPRPLILAGGLTAKNVVRAVKIVKPYAVDVSSGIETTPGRKDQLMMKAFILSAKSVGDH